MPDNAVRAGVRRRRKCALRESRAAMYLCRTKAMAEWPLRHTHTAWLLPVIAGQSSKHADTGEAPAHFGTSRYDDNGSMKPRSPGSPVSPPPRCTTKEQSEFRTNPITRNRPYRRSRAMPTASAVGRQPSTTKRDVCPSNKPSLRILLRRRESTPYTFPKTRCSHVKAKKEFTASADKSDETQEL